MEVSVRVNHSAWGCTVEGICGTEVVPVDPAVSVEEGNARELAVTEAVPVPIDLPCVGNCDPLTTGPVLPILWFLACATYRNQNGPGLMAKIMSDEQ